MATPFFSVVIPSFNRVHFLDRVLGYLKAQSFQDFEVIVVDDGSTDGTMQWGASLSDPMVRYVRQENQGVCAARNTGIAHARGTYITFLDTDDYVTTNWLFDFHHKLMAEPFEMVICRRALEKGDEEIDFRFLAGAFAISRQLLSTIGGYDTSLKFGENTELKWRIDKAKARIGYVEAVNFRYDNTSAGGGSNLKNKVDSFYYVRSKHEDLFRENKKLAQQYHQIAGVNCFRLGRLAESRKLLLEGYLKEPSSMKALGRFLFYSVKSLLPFSKN